MGKNYYREAVECAPREEISRWQSEGLVRSVRNAYENSGYYREKMRRHGVDPSAINGVEDLHKLPFVSKDDLREADYGDRKSVV